MIYSGLPGRKGETGELIYPKSGDVTKGDIGDPGYPGQPGRPGHQGINYYFIV